MRVFISLTAVLLLLTCTAQGDETAKLKSRAVSLRVLESTLKKGSSAEAGELCGITRVSGYVLDPNTKDVILFGKVDPASAHLQLDDLVVALRNERQEYATKEGNTYYHSSPGCSIDPDPAVIRKLQQLSPRSASEQRGGDDNSFIERWQAVAGRPQHVRVLGVPFDTHLAKVMVDADYYMKRLANGTVSLGIPGFKSLMDMRVDQAEKEFQAGAKATSSGPSMNRFWFCPRETTYEDQGGVTLLRDCSVKLLTEEEFLTSEGGMQGRGRPSPLAKEFADSFTAHYREIADARPIYRELESMFRFAALAKLMARTQTAGSGDELAYLTKQYHVADLPVSRELDGLTAHRTITHETPTADGKIIHNMLLVSCGGVSMDVRPRRLAAPQSPSTGKSGPALGKTILASRKSANALYWDIPGLE